MIRSVEFDLATKSEANQRFASRAGMFAKSNRVQKQRAAVRDVLAAHHTPPRLFVNATADPIPDGARTVTMAQVQASLGATRPNRITVRLTRIAPGELDDDNLRGALKAVRDAIAAWIGTNDRDPRLSWDYGQDRAGQHVYRVRIEITDDAPGDDRRVVLAETASAGRAAKSRVKRLTTTAAKGATNVRAREHTIIERSGDVVTYHPEPRGKPMATDLRDAAERVFARKPKDGDEGTVRRNGTLQAVTSSPRAAAEAAWSKATKPAERLVHAAVAGYGPRVQAEAEALAAMNEQAKSVACPTCPEPMPAPPGKWCFIVGDEPVEYGVHASRARAAGLPPYPSVAELNAGLRPVRVERPCTTCKVPGFRSCQDCHGTGKVAAWEWHPRDSKQPKRAKGAAASTNGHRDPGEERPARDLAPCTTCGAAVGQGCKIDFVPPGHEGMWQVRIINGVHEARARAAGIHVDGPPPPKAPTNGTRRLVPAAAPTPPPQAPPTAYAAWPWEQPRCDRCGGDRKVVMRANADSEGATVTCPTCRGLGYRVTRLAPLRLPTLPDELSRLVPPEHQARYGVRVTLTRTRLDTPQTGATWLFTMTTKETRT